MNNKIVGTVIIGIAILLGFIIFAFNSALTDIVTQSCDHGPECSMWGAIDFQTNVSIGIMIFIILVGLYFIFFVKGKEAEKVEIVEHQVKPKEISKESYKDILENLEPDEKLIAIKIIESKGTIFQSELVENSDFNKVKITRILDRLEGKGIIERKRRGMTNIVILKHS
ncbi:MAG: MarR family transcriptional regulator [Candidatus Woesearchaeota archaeon]